MAERATDGCLAALLGAVFVFFLLGWIFAR